MDDTVTTEEAARLAGVAASSIKRWSDEGKLNCVRTAGGHRRFRRSDVVAFLSSLRTAGLPGDEAGAWVRLLKQGSVPLVEAELLRRRASEGAWFRVANTVGKMITELGNCWRDGTISVADEHRASATLMRALNRVSQSLPSSPDAPSALLAVPEGEQHVLGLALAELTLNEAGWRTVWMGASTPAAEVVRVVEEGAVRLVAIAASVVALPAVLSRHGLAVRTVCRDRNVPLIFGGSGEWPSSEGCLRLHTFDALYAEASALLSKGG